ncbi:mRNA decay protein [Malassezia equina]|uniref:mRNA decay protein n=1 Tax=Malassezia equina TaxID=1381935 RepID=A0AAF0EEE6_9BASI|nr:mRNA decay protein [Malassezia equina]
MSTDVSGSNVKEDERASSRPATDSGTSENREKWRADLRDLNVRVWLEGPPPSSASLDSSLRRNSAFIKRLRQPNLSESKEQLLQELSNLNLRKYLDELVPSLPEMLWRNTSVKDRYAAVEILSALHVKFGGDEFTKSLLDTLAQELVPSAPIPETSAEQAQKEETTRAARYRALVRVATELVLVGYVGPVDEKDVLGYGLEWLFGILRGLLAQDRDHLYVSLVQGILRSFGSILLASVPEHEAGQPWGTAQDSDPAPKAPVSEEWQTKFRRLFETYYMTLTRHVSRLHASLQKQAQRNRDAYIRHGEVFEDRQATFERQAKDTKTLMESAQAIATMLHVHGLHLADPESEPMPKQGVLLGAKSTLAEMSARTEQELASGRSPWEDEETRNFYTDLCDLHVHVPPSLLAGGAQGDDVKKLSAETEEWSSLASLLDRLPLLGNRAMVDELAIELAFYMKPTARKRLVERLLSVPKQRWDLLPYYARLLATLHPHMPTLVELVVEQVDQRLRRMGPRSKVDAQTRGQCIVYLGELTKFGLVPEHIVFHTFSRLLSDFGRVSVEMLALLVETCGRYLYRMPATHAPMHSVLDQMRRKRAAHHLEEHLCLLLDNAYFECVPPDVPVVAQRTLSVKEQFTVHLFEQRLTDIKRDRLYQLVRALDWRDKSMERLLFELFTSPWRVRYDGVRVLADLLRDLQAWHAPFVVRVLDRVVEEIDMDLGQTDYMAGQQRVARVRYLGELFNGQLLPPEAVLDQLWRWVVRRVHRPDRYDDFTRVRLVCTLLQTCGESFHANPLRKRMDDFLVAFQYYMLTKPAPPVDVAFHVEQTLDALRPRRQRFPKKEVLLQRLNKILPLFYQRDLTSIVAGLVKTSGTEREPTNDESDSDIPSNVRDEWASSSDESDSQDDDDSLYDSQDESDTSDVEDDVDPEAALDEQADEELERELALLMAEAHAAPGWRHGGSATLERTRQVLSGAPVPPAAPASGTPTEASPDFMTFSLLSRKATQEIHVPAAASISVRARQQQEQEAAERQQLKAS